MLGFSAEAQQDHALTSDLERRTRWLPHMKRRLPLGRNLGWYAVVRACKPSLVVETGIKHGLGSLTLLRALKRNEEEGHPGRLISFDTDPGSGYLVPPDEAGRWTTVFSSTEEALAHTLEGEEVGVFIHDTPRDYERERLESATALAHAAKGAVLLSANGRSTEALPDVAREHGWRYWHFAERPAGHWYHGPGLGVAVNTDHRP